MVSKNSFFVLALLLCLSITTIVCSATMEGPFPVLRVIDGDTIDILYKGKKERVRFLNVDTPESVHRSVSRNTPMGKKASEYTKSRLVGQSVTLQFEGRKRGKYKRLLAYIFIDGQNYNIELVRSGWSKYYTKYGKSRSFDSEFQLAERYARAHGLNVWTSDKSSSLTRSRSIMFHGNPSSHIMHIPGCKFYNNKSSSTIFATKDQAIAAGYRPCKICQP